MNNQTQNQITNQGDQLNTILNNASQENNLQLILLSKLNELNRFDDISKSEMSSLAESFPLLTDDNGKMIDFTKNVNLDNGIILISKFLEKKYSVDKDTISELKLSELISIFSKNKEVTVLDLFNHVNNLFIKDKESFLKIVDEVGTISGVANTGSDYAKVESFINNLSSDKPLGKFGETTLNEVAVGLQNVKWDLVYENLKLTVHGVPLAVNGISFGIILNQFNKHYYSKPYPAGLTGAELQRLQSQRNAVFCLFAIVGAPLVLCATRYSGLALKDVFNLEISSPSKPQTVSDSSSQISNSGLFMVLNQIKNKIPARVKIMLNLIFLSLIVIKLLGFDIIVFIFNYDYLRLYLIVASTLIILYEILNLFILNLFIIKNRQISEVLPDPIINWLKGFEIISKNKIAYLEYKKVCYFQISMYLAIIIIANIFFI